MLITEFLEIKIHSSTINYYKQLGYGVRLGEFIMIPVEHLSKGSHVKVSIVCDYCGKLMERDYKHYLKSSSKMANNKDACDDCAYIKCRETNVILYGSENPMQNEEIKERLRTTVMNRYGVEFAIQSDIVKEKCKKTSAEKTPEEWDAIYEKRKLFNLEHYGVENYAQTQECKDKIIKTCLEKYGDTTPASSPETREKYRATSLERYGEDNYFKTEEFKVKNKTFWNENYGTDYYSQTQECIDKVKHTWEIMPIEKKEARRIKTKNTLIERYGVESVFMLGSFKHNRSVPASSQQKKIYHSLSYIFMDIEINFPFENKYLDIALFIEDKKIDLEYDGRYWHNEENDRARDLLMQSLGWKVFRVKSGEKLPELEILVDRLLQLSNSNSQYDEIILDDWNTKRERRI